METKIYKKFKELGALLFGQGVISATAGNMSKKVGGNIYITASGSMLGNLKKEDIVIGGKTEKGGKKPSVEYKVHRSIYQNTEYKSVIHAHPPTVIAVTDNGDVFKPVDAEGRLYMPEVPVVEVKQSIGSGEVAGIIPTILQKNSSVIIRDHGVFVAADSIQRAAALVSTLEFSAEIFFKRKVLNDGI
ncbi:MAG: class II aldolase/adducin family protein [Elusimicrobiota bacterium]